MHFAKLVVGVTWLRYGFGRGDAGMGYWATLLVHNPPPREFICFKQLIRLKTVIKSSFQNVSLSLDAFLSIGKFFLLDNVHISF